MQIAQTILSQLGGNKFIAMTGASSFSGGNDSLSFRIPQTNKKRVAAVVVKLEADDTYTVKFFRRRPFPVCIEVTAERANVYADNLRDIFTAETGLLTSL